MENMLSLLSMNAYAIYVLPCLCYTDHNNNIVWLVIKARHSMHLDYQLSMLSLENRAHIHI